MEHRTRREALAAFASAGLAALAGCEGLRGSGADSATGTTTDGSGSMPTDGPGPTTRRTSSMETAAGGPPPMVPVQGGTYTIGTDTGPDDARPAHEVTLSAFRLDRYEVTNAQFAAFLNAIDIEPVRGGDAPPGGVTSGDLRPGDATRVIEGAEGAERRPLVALDDEHARIGIGDGEFVVEAGYADHPVNEVSWYGARRFARWRGARLPTEAEWEAAARGREGRRYPWGDRAPTHEHAVFGQSSGETAPVGTHPNGATPSGIHDMAGNVSEWTSSLYRPYPYDADDGREDPEKRGERVTRGGAHVFFGPKELRTYYRTGFSREFDRGHRHIGFRCARSGAGDGRSK